ncbi:MAG: HK97 family phage prohead protease [Bacteroidales bacterium]|nr:HK97 family phage prohead protease [Bacteroidales bacterium]MDY6075541.1 HK97 family phage prohead protease [Bacteroidales bacterium]
MGKRVRITNDSLNSYGTRILTSGMEIGQYERNPVLLYQHNRGQVIGYVKDIRVENNEVTGELMFDCASELSQRCKKQFEFGSLRMVSVGIDVLETSEAKEHLVQGQTRATITKSKLFEVSLVDIGANDDAIVLHKDGELITLSKDEKSSYLPLISNNQILTKMEQKTLCLLLGLPETADEAAIKAAIGDLKKSQAEFTKLEAEKATLELERLTSAVDKAIGEKRIDATKKDQFVELGKKVGYQELQNVFAAMSPQTKLSAVIGHQGGAPTGGEKTYKKLSEVSSDEILKLRKEQPEEYKRLYKAEYGIECEL